MSVNDLERDLTKPSVDARSDILNSIRAYLAQSARTDAADGHDLAGRDDSAPVTFQTLERDEDPSRGLLVIDLFQQQLELAGGHFFLVTSEAELALTLGRVLELQSTGAPERRIALSDAPLLQRLAREMNIDDYEVTINPPTKDLFACDVGITTAQAAIAETGSLVLESSAEKHRLVSLVPPVHIAIVNSGNIYATLGEAIRDLGKRAGTSRAITFITGPSRTADIELTLSIGVHGPRELYVIVNHDSRGFGL